MHDNPLMWKLLSIGAALAFSVAASAQQFRWTDKDGRVQYGDVPPPGVKATRIKGPPASSAAPAPAADAKKDAGTKDKPLSPEAAFRKRQLEREEAEKKSAEERQKLAQGRENCERAQANLRQLESGQRIGAINAAGERVYLDDAQRAGQMQAAQKAVSDWCR